MYLNHSIPHSTVKRGENKKNNPYQLSIQLWQRGKFCCVSAVLVVCLAVMLGMAPLVPQSVSEITLIS